MPTATAMIPSPNNQGDTGAHGPLPTVTLWREVPLWRGSSTVMRYMPAVGTSNAA